jgi:hypothetical protein
MLSGTGYPSGENYPAGTAIELFFTRMWVRVTRRVNFYGCGYGYEWALPVGYVPAAILSFPVDSLHVLQRGSGGPYETASAGGARAVAGGSAAAVVATSSPLPPRPRVAALRLILTHALGANSASLFTFHCPLSIFFSFFSFHCLFHFPLYSVQFFSRLDFKVQFKAHLVSRVQFSPV